MNRLSDKQIRMKKFLKILKRKKVKDLKSYDQIYVPINPTGHWFLLIIDLKKKVFRVCDSMAGSNKLKTFKNLSEIIYEVTDSDPNDWNLDQVKVP